MDAKQPAAMAHILLVWECDPSADASGVQVGSVAHLIMHGCAIVHLVRVVHLRMPPLRLRRRSPNFFAKAAWFGSTARSALRSQRLVKAESSSRLTWMPTDASGSGGVPSRKILIVKHHIGMRCEHQTQWQVPARMPRVGRCIALMHTPLLNVECSLVEEILLGFALARFPWVGMQLKHQVQQSFGFLCWPEHDESQAVPAMMNEVLSSELVICHSATAHHQKRSMAAK